MDWLAGPLQVLGGFVRARVRSLLLRGLAFVGLAVLGLGLAIYYAANSLYGVTPAELPVLILFSVWFVGTIVALALYARSQVRAWSASGPTTSKPPAASPAPEVPLVQPRRREPGPSLGERARNLIPYVLTLLVALPLIALSLFFGGVVGYALEVAGMPESVGPPVVLMVASVTLAAGSILVFRRLWSRSPGARKRRTAAETRRLLIHDLDARIASPSISSERPEAPPVSDR